MATITAKMVSDLREKTGAGMMDCKRALVAADGDMEAAIENLRKSGIAKAEKKSGRSTNQGKVWTGICTECKSGAIVEVLCETDFAAKTERFVQLVSDVTTAALKAGGDGDVAEKVNTAAKETLTNAIATIGENMQIRRAVRLQGGDNSTFAGYHHMDGRVSVLVEFEGVVADELKKDICMHVGIQMDLPLFDDRIAIGVNEFDGVLNGDDVRVPVPVHKLQQARQSGGLAAAGRSGEQHKSLPTADQAQQHRRDPQLVRLRDAFLQYPGHQRRNSALKVGIETETVISASAVV